jgi:hypothetical protein
MTHSYGAAATPIPLDGAAPRPGPLEQAVNVLAVPPVEETLDQDVGASYARRLAPCGTSTGREPGRACAGFE